MTPWIGELRNGCCRRSVAIELVVGCRCLLRGCGQAHLPICSCLMRASTLSVSPSVFICRLRPHVVSAVIAEGRHAVHRGLPVVEASFMNPSAITTGCWMCNGTPSMRCSISVEAISAWKAEMVPSPPVAGLADARKGRQLACQHVGRWSRPGWRNRYSPFTWMLANGASRSK